MAQDLRNIVQQIFEETEDNYFVLDMFFES